MRFAYTVKDSSGKTFAGSDDASDQDTLVARLQKQGYFILKVQPFSETLPKRSAKQLSRMRKFTHDRVKLDDMLIFSHQLATMLEAGVSLLRSLDITSNQVESRQLSNILSDVKKDVEQGASLSASLAKHPKVFNQFWVSLVEVGEASGSMPDILNKLTFYLEQDAAFRSSLVSALMYPIILMTVAIGAIIFFALLIAPRFKELFDSFHVQLPILTAVLLNTFDVIKTKFLLFVGALGAIIIVVRKYAQTPVGRLQLENFLFNLPKFGYVFKTLVTERFTSQMSILIESGVPILYALDISQRMVGNLTCANIIGEIKTSVREGKLLAEPMSKSGFFPPMTVQMILIGEETGELSKMLKRVAEYYQNYVQTFIKRFATIFEPLMLVFMGVVIGTLVIAMFLPIFSLTQIK